MLGEHHRALFYGACFFIAAETVGTERRGARVCPVYVKPHSAPGVLGGGRGRSQALVCCNE